MMPNEQEEIDDSELTTPVLKIPDFRPSVPVSDIADFAKRDQKLVLSCYIFAQNIDWLNAGRIDDNLWKRKFEKEMMLMKRWRRTTTMKMAIISSVVVFVVTTISSGLFAKLVNGIISLLSHP